MEIDCIGLCRSGDHIVDVQILCSFWIAGLRDPNAHLAAAHAVGLAKAAFLQPTLGLALVIAGYRRPHLRSILCIEVVVESNVFDDHMHRANPVGAGIVHLGRVAVVLGAALRFEGAAAAERAVVARPNDVEALIADVTHGNEAAQHEAHPGGDHVLGMTIVHSIVTHSARGQEQRLRFPPGGAGGGCHIIRVAGPANGGLLGNQQLLADLEDPRGEEVGLDPILQGTSDICVGHGRLGDNRDGQGRDIRAAKA